MIAFSRILKLLKERLKDRIPPNFETFRDVATYANFMHGNAVLYEQAFASLQNAQVVANPANRLYVTKNANDQFGGNIQSAIDYAVSKNPSADSPWVIEILSPGQYTGNFTLYENIYLTTGSPATSVAVLLTSSTGNTLTLPDSNSGVNSIAITSDSGDTSNSAVSIVPSVSGGVPSVLSSCRAFGTNNAASIRLQPNLNQMPVGIFLDANANSPLGIDIQSGGLVIFGGGASNFHPTGTAIRCEGGSFNIFFQCVIQNDVGSPGYLLEVEGAGAALFSCNSIIASNCFSVSNGGIVIINNHVNANPPTGDTLTLDATSLALLGDWDIGGISPYATFNVADPNNVIYSDDLTFDTGTLAQRPTAPKPGMMFYATDQPDGAKQLIFIAGTGWVDQSDNIIP